jgi:hypothetical protein
MGMKAPIGDPWQEINSADRRRRRQRLTHVVFAGATAIAMLALFDAASLGTTALSVASGPVRLVDQTADLSAPPPLSPLVPAGVTLPPGTIVEPGGLPLPPLPPGLVLPPEVPQMLAQGAQMSASPPSNVPNEVCRFNTVRVPCP